MTDLATIVILAATHTELKPVRRHLNLQPTGPGKYSGQANNHRIMATVSGMGASPAINSLNACLQHERVSHLFHIGFAGGLNPALKPGQLLAIGRLMTPNAQAITLDPNAPHTLLTVDQPLTTVTAKAEARQQFQADAVDMESAAVAMRCQQANVCYVPIRAISDDAHTMLPPGIETLVTPQGTTNASALLKFLLANPLRIKALLQLNANAKTAGQAITNHVEEYLASNLGERITQ